MSNSFLLKLSFLFWFSSFSPNKCYIRLYSVLFLILQVLVMVLQHQLSFLNMLHLLILNSLITAETEKIFPSRWRHTDRDGVSNHQPHDCLFNRLFRRRSKKTSKLRVTGLCAGNPPGPVNSPHKWPVTRKMFPFDDVIMLSQLDQHNACRLFFRDHFVNASSQRETMLHCNVVFYWLGACTGRSPWFHRVVFRICCLSDD